jgi:hypothetical protein
LFASPGGGGGAGRVDDGDTRAEDDGVGDPTRFADAGGGLRVIYAGGGRVGVGWHRTVDSDPYPT